MHLHWIDTGLIIGCTIICLLSSAANYWLMKKIQSYLKDHLKDLEGMNAGK